MASYSALDFSECLDQHPTEQYSEWGRPNICVPPPSDFNPYNISDLADYRMGMLEEIVSNPAFGQNLGLCIDAAHLLPITFVDVDNIVRDPKIFNVGALTLRNFTRRVLPAPLNESDAGRVTAWWWGQTVRDTAATAGFLNATENYCTRQFCDFIPAVGTADISGIGMLVSTAMLIILAVTFSLPAAFSRTFSPDRTYASAAPPPPTPAPDGNGPDARRRDPPARRSASARVRDAIVGTLDDLAGALAVFAVSVQVAALVQRQRDEAAVDIFMAEALALVSSCAVVMVTAAHWAAYTAPAPAPAPAPPPGRGRRRRRRRLRPPVVLGFVVNAALTVVLFGVEARWQAVTRHRGEGSEEGLAGLPRELRCLGAVLGGPDVNRVGGKWWVLPTCFALWAVALLASLVHLPWARRGAVGVWALRVVGALPLVLGTAAIVMLCVMFYAMFQEMKAAFGDAFTDTESEWGFGQILALGTWVPPTLHFIHLLLDEMKNVLATRLPWSWNVYKAEPEEVEVEEERKLSTV